MPISEVCGDVPEIVLLVVLAMVSIPGTLVTEMEVVCLVLVVPMPDMTVLETG